MKKRYVVVKRKNIYVILGLLALLVGSLAYLALQKKTREGLESAPPTVAPPADTGAGLGAGLGSESGTAAEKPAAAPPAAAPPAAAPPAKKGTEAAITGILTSILGKS